MRVIYADTSQARFGHLPFNRAAIRGLFSRAASVEVFLNQEQIDAIGELASLKKTPIQVGDRPNRFAFFSKLLREVRNLFEIYRSSRKGDIIIFGGVFSNAQPFVALFSFLFPGRRVGLILHGELASINRKDLGRWLGHKPWVFMSFALARLSNVKLIVLEKRIAENLFSKLGVRSLWVDHPYVFSSGCGQLFNRENSKVTVIFPGTLSPERGAEHLVRLAESVAREKVAVEHVGGTRNLSADMTASLISLGVAPAAQHLDRKLLSPREYNEQISKADYLLFLFQDDFYEFASSGALLDAVDFQKPVLALRSEIVDYFFGGTGYPVFVFESIEDMAAYVNSLSSYDVQEAKPSDDAVAGLIRRHSPERFAESIFDQLSALR